jgi:hypothetical protein
MRQLIMRRRLRRYKKTLPKIVWAGYTSEESEREITLKPKTRITLIDPIHKEVQAGLM